MKEEGAQKTTDPEYELNGAYARITLSEGLESHMQAGVLCILRRAGRVRDGIETVWDQLVEHLQSDLHHYLNALLATLEARTANYCGPLG